MLGLVGIKSNTVILYLIMKNVNQKRTYDSPRRRAQAEATRNAVLDAAERLFRMNGWAATTIAAIAAEAGVSTETVFSRFGNKKTIVHEMVIRAMRGAQPSTPMMQQDERSKVLKAGDAVAMIDAFSADIAELLARVAPILAVVRSAAETDRDMADLYSDLHKSRRRNLSMLTAALAEKGALRPGLDAETAVDTLWSVASPELWLLRTNQLNLSPDAHREWLRTVLRRLLLA